MHNSAPGAIRILALSVLLAFSFAIVIQRTFAQNSTATPKFPVTRVTGVEPVQ